VGKSQRTKGAGFEREICHVLSESLGGKFTRNLDQVRDGGGDIMLPGYLIECKRRARISIYEWMEQATKACNAEQKPIVIARADNKDALAIMRLEDFILLLSRQPGGEQA
jgi:hypothetical protein